MAFALPMYAGATSSNHASETNSPQRSQRHSRRQSQSTSPLARSPVFGASNSPVFRSRGHTVGDGDLDDIPPLESSPSHVSIYDRVPLVTKKAIRLVRIHGGENGPLEGTLTSFSMADPPDFIEDPPNCGKPPPFVAFAYTYPPPKRLPPQGICGRHAVIFHGRYLPITEELNHFLLAWRSRKETSLPDWIWIDDICLNRSDRHEKNNHLMRDIYKAAKWVIVWPYDGATRGIEVYQPIDQ